MTASPIPSLGPTRGVWAAARNLFVRHAEKFVNATRYEEASAVADQAAREIEALFPVEAGDVGWRPIETAPKDGASIDLWHPQMGRLPDCYWGKTLHSCGEAGQYCDSDWHGEPDGWVEGALNCPAGTGFTHWMPLAASPPLAEEPSATNHSVNP